MTTKLANREPAAILKQSKSPIFLETRDLLFFAPTRHLESGDGPGDEIEPRINKVMHFIDKSFKFLVSF